MSWKESAGSASLFRALGNVFSRVDDQLPLLLHGVASKILLTAVFIGFRR